MEVKRDKNGRFVASEKKDEKAGKKAKPAGKKVEKKRPVTAKRPPKKK